MFGLFFGQVYGAVVNTQHLEPTVEYVGKSSIVVESDIQYAGTYSIIVGRDSVFSGKSSIINNLDNNHQGSYLIEATSNENFVGQANISNNMSLSFAGRTRIVENDNINRAIGIAYTNSDYIYGSFYQKTTPQGYLSYGKIDGQASKNRVIDTEDIYNWTPANRPVDFSIGVAYTPKVDIFTTTYKDKQIQQVGGYGKIDISSPIKGKLVDNDIYNWQPESRNADFSIGVAYTPAVELVAAFYRPSASSVASYGHISGKTFSHIDSKGKNGRIKI